MQSDPASPVPLEEQIAELIARLDRGEETTAATLALALCIACLHARAGLATLESIDDR